MSTKIKILLIVLAILLLAPVAATLFLNKSDARGIISSYLESETGRTFSIEGDLGISWGLIPTIYGKQVRLGNADWAKTPYAFTADEVRISLSIKELLKGYLKVTVIELDRPHLWIERHSTTEKFNLDLRVSSDSQLQARFLPDWIGIVELSIHNGSISYLHMNRDWDIELYSAKIDSPGANHLTNIRALGEVENTPVSIVGKLGNIESLLHYQESSVELNGYVGAVNNRISVTGVIQDLLRWHGLNLWIDAKISDLSDLSDLFGFWLPIYRDVSAQLELVQPESARTMQLESIKLKSQDYGLNASLEGDIGDAFTFDEVDLHFRANGKLDKTMISKDIAKQVELVTELSGSVTGGRENLVLNIENGKISNGGIEVQASGKIFGPLNDWSAPISIEMDVDNLASLGRMFELSLPDTHAINAGAKFYRKSSGFHLSDITITSVSGDVSQPVVENGNISNLGKEQSGEIRFDTVLGKDDLRRISDNKYLALVDQLSFSGVMGIVGRDVKFGDLKVLANGDGVDFTGTSTTAGMHNSQNLEMDVVLAVSTLEKLGSVVSHKLPGTVPFTVGGVLKSGSDGNLDLENISGTLDDPALVMSVSGRILNINGSPESDLNIDGQVQEAGPINTVYPEFYMFGLLDNLLPLKGSAQLTGKPAGEFTKYSLNNVEATTLSENYEGQIKGGFSNLFGEDSDQSNTSEGRLAMNLSGVLNDETTALDSIPFVSRSLVQGSFIGSAEMIFMDDEISLDKINVNIHSDQSALSAMGSMGGISPMQTDDLRLEFHGKSLNDLLTSPGLPFVTDQPVDGEIEIEISGNSRNYGVGLNMGNSDLSGQIRYGNDAEAVSDDSGTYHVKLFSENLDFTKILKNTEGPQTVFSTKPVNLDWLVETDAEIEFSAANFTSKKLALQNFTSITSVRDGSLHTQIRGESHKGLVGMKLKILKQMDGANVHLIIEGKNVDISVIPSAGRSAQDDAGGFSVNIDLEGAGSSISEIAGNANGVFLVEFDGAKIHRSGLELLSKDLFMGVVNAINPLSENSEFLNIECGAIHFIFEDGVATTEQGIAIKTDEFALLGGGSIELADESVKFIISTKARKGLGINTNSIAKMIRVGGTITKPVIETDASGLLQSGLAIGAAIASGGLTLLAQGLYDKTKANADVCRIAAESAGYPTIENVKPLEAGR